MKIRLIIYLTLSIFFSCTNKASNGDKKNKNETINDKELATILQDISEADEEPKILKDNPGYYTKQAYQMLETGDNEMYRNLSTIFIEYNSRPSDFLYFSQAMAMKYKNINAYMDTYYLYKRSSKILGNKESALYNFTLYNLAKAHELGYNIRTREILGSDTITNKNIKSSAYYLQKAYPDYEIRKK